MFSAAPRRSAPLSMLRSRSTGLTTLLDLWRSRRALAELDATRLDDIGLSADAAQREAARPLWDVPVAWRR